MIYFAELFMTGEQHVAHNAAMVETWLRAMPNERMTLFCSKDHYARLTRRFSNDWEKEPILRSMPVVGNKNGSKLWWVIKHLNEALLILFVLIKARFAKPKIVYFSFLSPIGQYWASLLIRCLRFRHRQVYITLHGLDILKGNNPKVIDRLYAYSLKKAFAMASKKKRYLVLETRASKYLMESGYLAASEMIELPHPYHFPEMETRSYAYPLTFVFLGVARLSKNAHLFFQLADLFSSEIRSGRVKFKLVGQILPELYPYLNEWVEYKPQAVMLDEEDYRRQCLTAHYAVFLYPEESYALTSSGAVMDAIAYNLPILALK
uniref:hypothetical protein n=1 Tax=Olivibacter sitiensis TaxID=376470 RepID=UPI00048525A7